MDNIQELGNCMKYLVETSLPNKSLQQMCQRKVTKYELRDGINKAFKVE
jgi:hypothetical protein